MECDVREEIFCNDEGTHEFTRCLLYIAGSGYVRVAGGWVVGRGCLSCLCFICLPLIFFLQLNVQWHSSVTWKTFDTFVFLSTKSNHNPHFFGIYQVDSSH
jgi:hypothetical protein